MAGKPAKELGTGDRAMEREDGWAVGRRAPHGSLSSAAGEGLELSGKNCLISAVGEALEEPLVSSVWGSS